MIYQPTPFQLYVQIVKHQYVNTEVASRIGQRQVKIAKEFQHFFPVTWCGLGKLQLIGDQLVNLSLVSYRVLVQKLGQ